MTADDLGAPLGRRPKKRRRSIKLPVPQIIVGALALFLAVFVLWAVIGDDPFGGEPMAVVPANLKLAAKPPEPAAAQPPAAPAPDKHAATPAALAAPAQNAAPANSTTVTIIDGKTGEKKEVVVPTPAPPAASPATPANSAAAPDSGPPNQKFPEMRAHGPIARITARRHAAGGGLRPPAKADLPRIALIVGGLGVSSSATADAIGKLPGVVTLGFVPYSNDVAAGGRATRATRFCCKCRWSRSITPTTIPDRRRC